MIFLEKSGEQDPLKVNQDALCGDQDPFRKY